MVGRVAFQGPPGLLIAALHPRAGSVVRAILRLVVQETSDYERSGLAWVGFQVNGFILPFSLMPFDGGLGNYQWRKGHSQSWQKGGLFFIYFLPGWGWNPGLCTFQATAMCLSYASRLRKAGFKWTSILAKGEAHHSGNVRLRGMDFTVPSPTHQQLEKDRQCSSSSWVW